MIVCLWFGSLEEIFVVVPRGFHLMIVCLWFGSLEEIFFVVPRGFHLIVCLWFGSLEEIFVVVPRGFHLMIVCLWFGSLEEIFVVVPRGFHLMIVCLAVVVDGCVSGWPELTELLLKSGADLTVLTANGDTVMHAAVYGNNLHIINMLIKAGRFSTLM